MTVADSDYRLQHLPWHIFQLLNNRDTGEARSALEGLADLQPEIARWLATSDAESKVTRLLESPESYRPLTTDYLPWPDVVRSLTQAKYRLIRNHDDLLAVLVEELELIGPDAANHLDLFYRPGEILKGPQRRHELALQQYVHCRLTDRLPGVVLHPETKVRKRQRTDLVVLAPITGRPEFAEVVIETKWSNHPQMARGLREQLGGRYLVSENKRHGIYLVGWCGRLSWRGVAVARPKEPTSLKHSLDALAHEFMKEHPGHDVRAVVFDLAWLSDAGGP